MFNKIFGGASKTKTIDAASPLTGKLVPLSEVPDEAFAQGYMGAGGAIEPTEGVVIAPFDGTVSHLIDTHHAVIVENAAGLQVLIHVGINTVQLKGEGFKALVKTGDAVKQGQTLIEFDADRIRAAGYPLITPFLVVSEEHPAESVTCAYGDVKAGQPAVLQVQIK
ncbi:PTS sugar transporter subunit IIA [Paenibacillus kobensis]|uniref:PTS sugar transporter subunit IIA n=1 Tax=Paenibacillus kobensis TaxID=59841 RepID=UPI000FD6CDFB|nr:PTS glucose transporter subunit IIA [Paenibacillus kobensis]